MRTESGDAFVNHMQAEHRRLELLIRCTLNVIRDWHAAGADCSSTSLQAGVAAIRQELAQHFAEEESGGCLEEAVARCPALSHAADRVQSEHSRLLATLDEFTEHCWRMERPTRRDLVALEQELRAVAHQVRLHEAEEIDILERGFAICLDNEDSFRDVNRRGDCSCPA